MTTMTNHASALVCSFLGMQSATRLPHIWRYVAIGVGIAVVVALLVYGAYAYVQFVNTVPECAKQSHHGIGDCPAQLLRWYPQYF